MIVVDTSALYAAVDRNEPDHRACTALFQEPPDTLVVPLSVVVETCMLFERRSGPSAEERFLEAMAESDMTFAPLARGDLRRIAELVRTYRSLPLGAVDASIVTVAERTGSSTILTLDRRHFGVVRPRHADSFTLLP